MVVYTKVGSVIFNTVSFGSRMFSDSTEYLIFELVRFIEQLSHFAIEQLSHFAFGLKCMRPLCGP